MNASSPRRMKSRSVCRSATARRTARSTSGAWVSSSSSNVRAVNTNMPEFHRCRPSAASRAALAASGFSTKLRDREGAGRIVERGADRDVAVAGLRRGRAHAEGDDAAGACRRGGGGEAAVAAPRCRRSRGRRRAATAPRRGRLRRPARRRRRWRGRCCGRPAPAGCAARGCAAARSCSAIRKRCSWLQTTIGGAKRVAAGAERGLLEHRVVGDQRPELLGEALARDRPEAGAGAAGEDDGDDRAGFHGRGMCPKRAGGGQRIVRARLTGVSIAGG